MKALYKLMKFWMVLILAGVTSFSAFAEDPRWEFGSYPEAVNDTVRCENIGDEVFFYVYDLAAQTFEPIEFSATVSPENVARIYAEGIDSIVVATGYGEANYTLAFNDGANEVTKTYTIIVGDENSAVITDIALMSSDFTLHEGDSYMLDYAVTPVAAQSEPVLFSSSEEAIATVDQATGEITAVSPGVATITVASVSDPSIIAGVEVVVVEAFIPVQSIVADRSSMALEVNAVETIIVIAMPADATNLELIFTSSDPSIATVSEAGAVTALAEGECVITITSMDGGGAVAEVPVIVGQDSPPPPMIEFYASEDTILLGTSRQIEYYTTSSMSEVVFESSDDAILTIDNTGMMTALDTGTVSVMGMTIDAMYQAETVVTVYEIGYVPVEHIEVIPNITTLSVGESVALPFSISPANISEGAIIYTSDDATIASVTSNGRVLGKSAGSVTVTAQSADDQSVWASTVIEVLPTVEEFYYALAVGDSVSLADSLATVFGDSYATYTVVDTGAAGVEYSMSWSGSVYYTYDGTPQIHDSILIQAQDLNDVVLANFHITFLASEEPFVAVTELQAPTILFELRVGQNDIWPVNALPYEATDRTLSYASSDESIATVDSYGRIHAVYEGTATITATSISNPSLSVETTVTVVPIVPPVEILFLEDAMTVDVDNYFYLSYTVLPANADTMIAFTSSDYTIVSVENPYGYVRPQANGTATITAYSTLDSSVFASIDITVTGAEVKRLVQYQVIDLSSYMIKDTFEFWAYDTANVLEITEGVYYPLNEDGDYYFEQYSATYEAPVEFEVDMKEHYGLTTYTEYNVDIQDGNTLDISAYIPGGFDPDSVMEIYFDQSKITQNTATEFTVETSDECYMMIVKSFDVVLLRIKASAPVLFEEEISIFQGHYKNLYGLVPVKTPVYFEVADDKTARVTMKGDLIGLNVGYTTITVRSEFSDAVVGKIFVTVLHRGLYNGPTPDYVEVQIGDVTVSPGKKKVVVELNVALDDVDGLEDYIYVEVYYKNDLKSDLLESKIVLVTGVSLSDSQTLVLEMEEALDGVEKMEVVFLEGGITSGGKTLQSVPMVAQVDTVTDVTDASTSVAFWPNPCSNVLSVSGAEHIMILTLDGAVIFSVSGTEANSIDVSSLASGAYTLVLESEIGIETQQLIKQ